MNKDLFIALLPAIFLFIFFTLLLYFNSKHKRYFAVYFSTGCIQGVITENGEYLNIESIKLDSKIIVYSVTEFNNEQDFKSFFK